jgi:hypothetical protein
MDADPDWLRDLVVSGAKPEEQAAEIADNCIGFTEEQVRALLARFPGTSLRVAAFGGPVTNEFVFGRLTVFLRDGRVAGAMPG